MIGQKRQWQGREMTLNPSLKVCGDIDFLIDYNHPFRRAERTSV